MDFERRRENYTPQNVSFEESLDIDAFINSEPIIYSISSKPAEFRMCHEVVSCTCHEKYEIEQVFESRKSFHVLSDGKTGLGFTSMYASFSFPCNKCKSMIKVFMEPMKEEKLDVHPKEMLKDPKKMNYPSDQPWIVAIQAPPAYTFSKGFINCGHCDTRYHGLDDIIDIGNGEISTNRSADMIPNGSFSSSNGLYFRCKCGSLIESRSQSVIEED